MTNRTIIIGDVHGMSVELEKLLTTLELRDTDQVVFVGDLVDKGPESPQVVRMVRELSERFDVTVVEGNHEEKHRRFRKHRVNGTGVDLTMKGSEEMREITDGLSDEDVRFMETFVPFHRVPEHDVLVVHGGIPGKMTEFPETVEELRGWSSKQRKRFSKTMRTRFVDGETGRFLQLGERKETDPFWSEVYDGRFGHVVFGHEPFMDGPGEFRHSTGVDTGCVFGGRLTSLVLEGGERSFVSVESRGSFCDKLQDC
ncbi:MAG: metallophosphoesterase [Planctomycetota bacterium]|nr:metallophosphoesterase [Planctomycetota bacterium]